MRCLIHTVETAVGRRPAGRLVRLVAAAVLMVPLCSTLLPQDADARAPTSAGPALDMVLHNSGHSTHASAALQARHAP